MLINVISIEQVNENVYKLVGPVDASTNKEDGETQSAVSSDE